MMTATQARVFDTFVVGLASIIAYSKKHQHDPAPQQPASQPESGLRLEAKPRSHRNPALASHAFHILHYQGMGSGIPRAVEDWPQIEFADDRQGNQFRVTLKRIEDQAGGVNGGVNGGVKASAAEIGDLIKAIQQNPGLRAPALAGLLGVTPKKVEHWIKQLRDGGKIEFVGTSKTGGYRCI